MRESLRERERERKREREREREEGKKIMNVWETFPINAAEVVGKSAQY